MFSETSQLHARAIVPCGRAQKGTELEYAEQLLDVFTRFYFPEDGFDPAIGSDDEGGALRAEVLLAVHAFLHPDAVRIDDLLLLVGEQRKGE